MAIGGLLVALGIVGFVFEVAQAPPAPPAVVQPIPIKVYLRSPKLKTRLCGATVVDGVAVAGRLRQPEVVVPSFNTEGRMCPAQQFTVSPKQGIAVPQVVTSARDRAP